MMSKEFYKFVCECCNVDAITPETIRAIRETLKDILPLDICAKTLISENVARIYKNLIISPTPSLQTKLYKLYELGRKNRFISYGEWRDVQPNPIRLQFLEMWQPPPIRRLYNHRGYIEIDTRAMEKYWSNIEKFKYPEYRRVTWSKATKIQQVLEILNVSSIDALSTEDISKIKELRRGDFRSRGYDISYCHLKRIKLRLINYVIGGKSGRLST